MSARVARQEATVEEVLRRLDFLQQQIAAYRQESNTHFETLRKESDERWQVSRKEGEDRTQALRNESDARFQFLVGALQKTHHLVIRVLVTLIVALVALVGTLGIGLLR